MVWRVPKDASVSTECRTFSDRTSDAIRMISGSPAGAHPEAANRKRTAMQCLKDTPVAPARRAGPRLKRGRTMPLQGRPGKRWIVTVSV